MMRSRVFSCMWLGIFICWENTDLTSLKKMGNYRWGSDIVYKHTKLIKGEGWPNGW